MAYINRNKIPAILRKGDKGDNGDSAFIRYSANSDGTGMTEERSEGQNYIGFATGQTAPTDKSGYTWLYLASEKEMSGKVDKLDPLPNYRGVYTVDSNGNIELIPSTSTAEPYSFVTRSGNGNANIAYPTEDEHIANKKYVDDGLSIKLNLEKTVTDKSQVYVKRSDGIQQMLDLSSGAERFSVVFVGANGRYSAQYPINAGDVANKQYVDEEIAKFDFIKIASSLDAVTNPLPNKIYLIPNGTSDNQNLFDEWIFVNDKWEWITTKEVEVDLTPYVKKDEVDEFLALPLKTGVGVNSLAQKTEEGKENAASGEASTVFGLLTEAEGKASTAIGIGTRAIQEAQFASGKYNAENPDALLMVGNGTSGKRSNAFEVISKNGVSSIKVGNTEISEEQLNKLLDLLEPKTIKFTYNGDEFYAYDGMTWREFCESSLNHDIGFGISGAGKLLDWNGMDIGLNGTIVNPDDVIIEDGSYEEYI